MSWCPFRHRGELGALAASGEAADSAEGAYCADDADGGAGGGGGDCGTTEESASAAAKALARAGWSASTRNAHGANPGWTEGATGVCVVLCGLGPPDLIAELSLSLARICSPVLL